jgi:sugar lactone lactonase YvrE
MRNLVAALLFALIAPPAFAADPAISTLSTGACPVTAMVSGAPGVLWLDCGWTSFAKLSTATGELSLIPDVRPILPSGMAAAPDGSLFAASDRGIVHIAISGEATLVSSRIASGLTLDGDGNLWFLYGHTISRLAPSGTITDFPLAPDSMPYSLVIGPDRNVWFTDRSFVCRFTPDGLVKSFELPVPFPGTPVGNLINAGRDLITSGAVYVPAFRITTDGVVSLAGGGFGAATATADGKVWFTTDAGFASVDGEKTRYFDDGAQPYWGSGQPLFNRPAMATAADGIIWYARSWLYPQPICYPSDPVPGQPPQPPQCIQPPPAPDLPNVLVRVDPLGRKKHRLGPVA